MRSTTATYKELGRLEYEDNVSQDLCAQEGRDLHTQRQERNALLKEVKQQQQEHIQDDNSNLTEEELRSLYLDMLTTKDSDEADVQIQDCDGLGEQEHRLDYTNSKRRKSIEALAAGEEVVSHSPLTQESEWDWNGEEEKSWDVFQYVDYGGVKEVEDENEDLQMREVLMGRSELLRRNDGDDGEEKFGDEG